MASEPCKSRRPELDPWSDISDHDEDCISDYEREENERSPRVTDSSEKEPEDNPDDYDVDEDDDCSTPWVCSSRRWKLGVLQARAKIVHADPVYTIASRRWKSGTLRLNPEANQIEPRPKRMRSRAKRQAPESGEHARDVSK